MFLADHHTHSSCSPDGTVPMRDMAQGAVQNGVQDICITDHCDFLSLEGQPTPGYDWAPVLTQYHEMQSLFGKQLSLRLGIEYGVPYYDVTSAQDVLSQPE